MARSAYERTETSLASCFRFLIGDTLMAHGLGGNLGNAAKASSDQIQGKVKGNLKSLFSKIVGTAHTKPPALRRTLKLYVCIHLVPLPFWDPGVRSLQARKDV